MFQEVISAPLVEPNGIATNGIKKPFPILCEFKQNSMNSFVFHVYFLSFLCNFKVFNHRGDKCELLGINFTQIV